MRYTFGGNLYTVPQNSIIRLLHMGNGIWLKMDERYARVFNVSYPFSHRIIPIHNVSYPYNVQCTTGRLHLRHMYIQRTPGGRWQTWSPPSPVACSSCSSPHLDLELWPGLLLVLVVGEVPLPGYHRLATLPKLQEHCRWGRNIGIWAVHKPIVVLLCVTGRSELGRWC